MPAYHFLPQHTAPPILVVRLHLQVSRAQRDPMALEIFLSTNPWRKISSCTILHFNSRMKYTPVEQRQTSKLIFGILPRNAAPQAVASGNAPLGNSKAERYDCRSCLGVPAHSANPHVRPRNKTRLLGQQPIKSNFPLGFRVLGL